MASREMRRLGQVAAGLPRWTAGRSHSLAQPYFALLARSAAALWGVEAEPQRRTPNSPASVNSDTLFLRNSRSQKLLLLVMKAVVVTSKGQTELQDFPVPEASSGHVVVKVRHPFVRPPSELRLTLCSTQTTAIALNPTDWKHVRLLSAPSPTTLSPLTNG